MHTPGPWVRIDRTTIVSETSGEIIAGEPIAIVPQVAEYIGQDAAEAESWMPLRQEREANARLIAAAPDLLYALEAVSAWYSASLDYQPPYVKLARAAIAKATGGRP